MQWIRTKILMMVDKTNSKNNLGLNDPANTLGANIQTANKWKTARTLSLTGHITGSVSVDGSGDAIYLNNISR